MGVINYEINIFETIKDFILNSKSEIISNHLYDGNEIKVLMPEWIKWHLINDFMSKGYFNNPNEPLFMFGLEVSDNYEDKIIVYVEKFQPTKPIFKELDLTSFIV